MIKVITDFPIAFDSPDHLHPWGTANDNTGGGPFVSQVLVHFGGQINFMDIGTAGGYLPIEFHEAGCLAVGIEGSDYNLKRQDYSDSQRNWQHYHNKVLFTADASRAFEVVDEKGKRVLFDLITAWEVVEHIHPDRLGIFFENISKHLKVNGFFVGSISILEEERDGIRWHQSWFTQEEWKLILEKYWIVEPYPQGWRIVRDDAGSFYVKLRKKNSINKVRKFVRNKISFFVEKFRYFKRNDINVFSSDHFLRETSENTISLTAFDSSTTIQENDQINNKPPNSI